MNYSKHLKNPIFNIVSLTADELNFPTYVVGGWVRDLLLCRKKNVTDIDFVCIGDSMKLAKKVAEKLGTGAKLQRFKNFGTAMINYSNENYEFVGGRKESYRTESRKPIVENGTLEDDQNRRDFTINAMAIQLNKLNYGTLIDPFNGITDLKNKIIRTPLDPNKTYSDDPLRMMRAIRFSTELDFKIHEESFCAIQKNSHRIKIISQERITEEMNKIILSSKPSNGFKLLSESSLLEKIFPQIVKLQGVEVRNGHAHKDNFYHTLEVLDNVSDKSNDLWLRWAAILHDIAKPITKKYEEGHGWTFHAHEYIGGKMVKKIFRQMKLPLNHKLKYVEKMVFLHLRPIVLAQNIVTDSAIRRLLFDAGDDIDDLMLLCDADITSKNPKKVKKYLNNFQLVRKKLKEVENKDKIRNFQPPISGDEIMELFNLSPSKEVGILKNSIKDAILDGKVKNNKKQALKFILDKAKKLNIKQKK